MSRRAVKRSSSAYFAKGGESQANQSNLQTPICTFRGWAFLLPHGADRVPPTLRKKREGWGTLISMAQTKLKRGKSVRTAVIVRSRNEESTANLLGVGESARGGR